MAAFGRKNVHGKTGVRFKTPYTASKNKNMLRNVVTELIVYDHVTVTSGVVKELKSLADRLVTYAKKGDLHSRRLAAAIVRNYIVDAEKGTTALDKLFTEIGPRFANRNGGYTRAIKTVARKGDNATCAIVTFVD